jgi:SH3-like domain-containing protein
MLLQGRGPNRSEPGDSSRPTATWAAACAPSDDPSLRIFTIHEGTKVRIDRTRAEWLRVAPEAGTVGWVKGDVVERI